MEYLVPIKKEEKQFEALWEQHKRIPYVKGNNKKLLLEFLLSPYTGAIVKGVPITKVYNRAGSIQLTIKKQNYDISCATVNCTIILKKGRNQKIGNEDLFDPSFLG